jgi:outer membrane receptor for ferrienterochelin and colicins
MKIFLPVLGLLLIAAFSSGLNAKTAIGTLQGTVTDARGKAIAGATVTIQTSDGHHPHATHTDANGHFAFTRFATGQYDLRAYSLGSYSDWTKRVPIRLNKATQIVLRISGPKA